jgi:hypothetical protein
MWVSNSSSDQGSSPCTGSVTSSAAPGSSAAICWPRRYGRTHLWRPPMRLSPCTAPTPRRSSSPPAHTSPPRGPALGRRDRLAAAGRCRRRSHRRHRSGGLTAEELGGRGPDHSPFPYTAGAGVEGLRAAAAAPAPGAGGAPVSRETSPAFHVWSPRQPSLSTPPGTGAPGSYGSRVKTNDPRSRWLTEPSSRRTTRSVSPA